MGFVALFLFLDRGDAPLAGAPGVAARPCADMENLDNYDFTSIVEATYGDDPLSHAITTEARVSGNDYHTVQRFDVEEGEGRMEDIWLGGVGYRMEAPYDRRLGIEWEVVSWSQGDITALFHALGSTPICPDLSNLTWKGQEELDGVKTTVYVSGDTYDVEKDALDNLDRSFQGERTAVKHEYWVDGNGLLVQHEMESYTLVAYEGIRSTGRYFTQTKFSGIGEPNTITVPVVP